MPSKACARWQLGQCVIFLATANLSAPPLAADQVLTLAQYRDKMQGSWYGQFAGAQWGEPFEFKYPLGIIPDPNNPNDFNHKYLHPTTLDLNDGFRQDQLYVQIPFLEAMRDTGLNATWPTLGKYFSTPNYSLWSANSNARNNLRQGIPAPMSGHYFHNGESYTLSTMIASSFAGDIHPGNLSQSIELAWRAAHVTTYGNGVYGFVHMAAMHSAAYLATSLQQVIDAGAAAIPANSQYGEMVRDVINWSAMYPDHSYNPPLDQNGNPTGWMAVWHLLVSKYYIPSGAPPATPPSQRNDAILHGGFVLIGLIYGDGDYTKSIQITIRSGNDTDCAGSMMGGVLGTYLGYSHLPSIATTGLNLSMDFEGYTGSPLPAVSGQNLFDMTESLARNAVTAEGGTVESAGQSGESWSIPIFSDPVQLILEQEPFPVHHQGSPNAIPSMTASLVSRQGNTVSFSALASDSLPIVDYEWFFGDSTYAKGAQVSHTYAANGTYQVVAYAANEIGNTANVVLNVVVGTTPLPVQINCGGVTAAPFQADIDFTGGTATDSSKSVKISTSNAINPAPPAVYGSKRTGSSNKSFSYVIPNLAPTTAYHVRLHFAEFLDSVTGPGQRQFNVTINGKQVLQNFDIFKEVGKFMADIKEFDTTSDALGNIEIDYAYGAKGNPTANGIEITTK